ncbi:hypothetical protein JX265_007258 [Neoarthrinium moseri]|uniref:Small nuclear ribonucleoprotein Prp3 C-terminal domain-containing protein n=1 Tax=Neoarthrinium moseri TaxID=1658444 RepID=A0A9Q0AN81_9PEZI|nr:hypothetical protein JX266_003598 [Neoarthrinium moseri]KAI1867456.1 hypothetical protein JX265_007258 [Neoarthrinium moseri]
MPRILPRELLEAQLHQVELLLAMYPDDAEIEGACQSAHRNLASWVAGDSDMPTDVPDLLSISLNLDLSNDVEFDEQMQARAIPLSISIPLQYGGDEIPADAPVTRVRIKQPPWMSKAELSKLQAELPDEDLDLVLDHIKQACIEYIESSRNVAQVEPQRGHDEPLVRVWFYFPSISTRSKRDDLINHGPSYGLTGFLLAGKPGILCLEGGSRSIDEYMKFIKTDSWGDIPAHHKKVSERYREISDVQRVFKDIQEITDTVGEKRGERANRGDMKAVEAWLDERGLGDAFKKVLM